MDPDASILIGSHYKATNDFVPFVAFFAPQTGSWHCLSDFVGTLYLNGAVQAFRCSDCLHRSNSMIKMANLRGMSCL